MRCDIPDRAYSAEQTRQLDAAAIAKTEGGGYILMRRAGKAAFRILRHEFPDCQSLTIFCGGGNNGGDGYVVAELALKAGFQVDVIAVSAPDKLTGEAREAWLQALSAGVTVQSFSHQTGFNNQTNNEGQLIVDALLGTGLSGSVRGDYAQAIEAVNQCPAPVLSIDIPSGLAADTGMPLGPVVKADATVTFIGVKKGLLTGKACDFTGELWFDGLEVSDDIYDQIPAQTEIITLKNTRTLLKTRAGASHKGDFGHVLVIGGDEGFGGAALLASEAACSAGAGLVSCATHARHVTAGLARQPGIMYRDGEQRTVLLEMIGKADVLVVGPGLGQSPWSQMGFAAALESGKPLVMDADGLNLLSVQQSELPPGSVITPHPGEAGRLLEKKTTEVMRDRFAAVSALSQKYGCTALLKGYGSLISKGEDDGRIAVVSGHGNPGMAKGGMGDVLSGIIGALMAQGLPGVYAARLGACWHAAAADELARKNGYTSVAASDLCQHLGPVLVANDE